MPPRSDVGRLSLQLTGTDSQGRLYRLRNAQFCITNSPYGWGGCPSYYPGYDAGVVVNEVVSTEADPDADAITVRLLPGDYTVNLQGSWYIERLTASGPERIERAALLSPVSQYAYVWHGGYSQLVFRFGVDGDLIDFRHGDLVIDTEFELPGESRYDAGYPPYPSWDAGVMRPF